MATVKNNQHTKFAEENNMVSFLMSAKNGDQVKHCFWKISASLASVPFHRFEQESQPLIVPATIIDHKRYRYKCHFSVYNIHQILFCRHDENVNEGKVPEFIPPAKSSCNIS